MPNDDDKRREAARGCAEHRIMRDFGERADLILTRKGLAELHGDQCRGATLDDYLDLLRVMRHDDRLKWARKIISKLFDLSEADASDLVTLIDVVARRNLLNKKD